MNMIPLNYENKRERSLCHLRLHRAFAVPEKIKTSEDAARAALCDLIAFESTYDIGVILQLSAQLLSDRDLAAPHEAVIFDINSLSEYYDVERRVMLIAARLCGAQDYVHGNVRQTWADDQDAKFVLDSSAIKEMRQ